MRSLLRSWPGRSLAIQTISIAVVAFALLLAGVACAEEQPTATPTPTPEPVDPKKELQRTVDQLLVLQSATFDLEHIVGSSNILPNILMHRAYGKAIVPGKFAVTVESELLFPRSYLEIGMISVDGRAYMTNVLNAEWGEVTPESLPINLADFGATLARIVEKVESPELLDDDRIDGKDVFRINGEVQSEDLAELVPAAGTGLPVALEIWIEQETGVLRQAFITGQVVATDVPETQRLLTIDDVNESLSIEPPPGF